ncbi:MAG: ASKHA domain-containing protein, partial [Acetatifactor sp.]|nr:ASKHA domain-containing protein [Acetatifactor sp.]
MCRVLKKGLRCQICTGCGLCPGVTWENGGFGGPRAEAMREDGEPVGLRAEAMREDGESVGLHTEVARKDSGSGRLQVLTEDALRGARIPFARSGKRLAVADIGTTTIAMLLYGSDGSVADRFVEVNPQTAYGADVLSRIRAAEKPSAAAAMRESVRSVLGKGLKRFRKKLSAGEELCLVIAANTTMTYLLMGWDTAELGHAPFRASGLSGAETEIDGVSSFVLPGFSAFVGGDILTGCCACGMTDRKEITLLIDLGTNGELLLGNCDRRIACATAAGPAFEGGAN